MDWPACRDFVFTVQHGLFLCSCYDAILIVNVQKQYMMFCWTGLNCIQMPINFSPSQICYSAESCLSIMHNVAIT